MSKNKYLKERYQELLNVTRRFFRTYVIYKLYACLSVLAKIISHVRNSKQNERKNFLEVKYIHVYNFNRIFEDEKEKSIQKHAFLDDECILNNEPDSEKILLHNYHENLPKDDSSHNSVVHYNCNEKDKSFKIIMHEKVSLESKNEEKILSSDHDCLSTLNIQVKKGPMKIEADTACYENKSLYGSKDSNFSEHYDQWYSSLTLNESNGGKEMCNQNIVYKDIIKEALTSKNLRINSEVTSIYMVNIPRHPSTLGDIQWSLLKEEKWRLHTFSRYPHDAPKSAIVLAAEGFAYIGAGIDDSVICTFCNLVKKNWQPSDDISQVHKQLSPCCSFVTKINCTNVPLDTSLDENLFNQLFKPRVNIKRGQSIQNNGYPSANNLEAPERNTETNVASPIPGSVVKGRSRSNIFDRSSSASQAVSNVSDRITSSSFQNSITTANHATASTATNASLSAQSLTSSSSLHTDSIFSHSATPSSQRPVTTAQSSTVAGQSLYLISTVPTATASSTTVPMSTIQAGTGANQSSVRSSAGGPTCSELGLLTGRPNRFEYALLARRMETFLSWPRDHHLKPIELAEAGFYYTGNGDGVRCFYCGGGLHSWEQHDDVWVEHARQLPNCPYIRQQMGQSFVDAVQRLNKTNAFVTLQMVLNRLGQTTLTSYLESFHHESNGRSRRQIVEYVDYEGHFNTTADIDTTLLLMSPPIIDNPSCSSIENRLRTFHGTSFGWPEILARAGFYFVGYNNAVRCFCCGGGLWLRNSAPEIYLIHAWHFPLCGYIRCLLGDHFIKSFHSLERLGGRLVPDGDNILREEEIERIPETMLCSACHGHRAAILFLPCRHMFLCLSCGFGVKIH